MARASNIYVLTDQGGSAPAFAFTVKHELLSHMRCHEQGLPGRNVIRLPDGRWASTAITTAVATEFLAKHPA